MYISCVFISLIKIIHTEKIGWHFKMSLNFDIIFLFVDLSLKDKRNHKFISDFWFLIKLECLNSNPNIEQTLMRKCLEFVTKCTLHKWIVLKSVYFFESSEKNEKFREGRNKVNQIVQLQRKWIREQWSIEAGRW